MKEKKTKKSKRLWDFTNGSGDFVVNNADTINRLYFPLANEAEFMSSVTPLLQGDIKISQNHFLTHPITTECLYNIKASRNFWIYINDKNIWSVTGTSYCRCEDDKLVLKAGMIWHTVIRECKKLGLKAEVTNFIPSSGEHVELMSIKLTNNSSKMISFTPTSAIPIFGRSADNLRDHRHVTSLLNRIEFLPQGVLLKPVMSFDERGHEINEHSYFVFGYEGKGVLPLGCFPTVESFIGEGGCLEHPRAIIDNLKPVKKIDMVHQGKEAMGALRFKSKVLAPGKSVTYVLMMGIAENPQIPGKVFKRFGSLSRVEDALQANKYYWKQRIDKIKFHTADNVFDNWLRWVTLQPILRKIFGCSFLPDFDYGRGGKGWRDLWQDCLTLIFIHPKKMREILSANFSGIRIDGTNATIITKKAGCFVADRNKIPRVWMDHGVWPYFTLQLYIHQTGDLNVLLDEQPYFYDKLLSRAREIDYEWDSQSDNKQHLLTKQGQVYKGTILEHILVQHLISFFHVGKHNNIKLEDADWNDGLDMASEKGESVAFTCFYGWNLCNLTVLLQEFKKNKKQKNIFLAKELVILLDSLQKTKIDYNSVDQKRYLLSRYFDAVKYKVSGKKVAVKIDDLVKDLNCKWKWLFNHVNKKEWVSLDKKNGFFNGYYDNKGRRVEGKSGSQIRMTLTGQVFPLMSGIATQEQIKSVFKAASKYLMDKNSGGFRLNTDFKSLQFDFGRAFAFVYGSKENGAVFSHMCVMFANALYQRGFTQEGFKVLNSLFKMASNTKNSKIYPCLPEYFDIEGKGMYSYLTGSASWYIMTVLAEMFGVKGHFGDLVIEPKLVREQFKTSDTLSVSCYFAERALLVSFKNSQKLDYGKYIIKNVKALPNNIPFIRISSGKIIIERKHLQKLPKNLRMKLEITLS
ncbi:MAG: cellobiose phosphorylase [Candidatus Omnitrophota bacterium]